MTTRPSTVGTRRAAKPPRGPLMPWFPDFVSAVRAGARARRRAAGHADPVGQYLAALNDGDTQRARGRMAGDVVIHDPRAGEIRGHRQLRQFVRANRSWMAEHHVTHRRSWPPPLPTGVPCVGAARPPLRHGGQDLAWPVAVVAESPNDAVRGVPHLLLPVAGRWATPRPAAHPRVGRGRSRRCRRPLPRGAGRPATSRRSWARSRPDGYLREFVGPRSVHAGTPSSARTSPAAFATAASASSPAPSLTTVCAVSWSTTCVRWGRHEVPAQAGIVVFERGPDGLLTAVRSYDDVEPLGSADS